MEIVGKAKRVRIYVGERDAVRGRPLHLALLELLRRERARGATVLRGIEGFGADGAIQVSHLVDVSARLPIVVEWIDTAEQVERLAPQVRALVGHGLITVDDVDLLLFEPPPLRDLPPTRTVADVMTGEVARVAPATPLREVVETALGKVYRAVPVVEDGRPVGIVTSGDLVRRGGLPVRLDLLPALDRPEVRAILDRLASAGRTARDVMTPAPVVVGASTPLPVAAEEMVRRRLKRLPVVDAGGRLVGMVSRLDLLRTVAGGPGAKAPVPRELGLAADAPLARWVRRDVPTVHPDTPLAQVLQAVMATRLNRALVVDDARQVVGLVTDAELLERVTPGVRPGALRALMQRLPFGHRDAEAPGAHARGRTAADLMRTGVATVREEATLADAVAAMLDGGQKVVAVLDGEGRLAGIVDRADLLHGLVSVPA